MGDVVKAVAGVALFVVSGGTGIVAAFGLSMVASAIVSKIFAPDIPKMGSFEMPNPGNRQQLPPSGSNKLPVVYGTAYVGGIITDLSITQDNQDIYWVFSLCEVTNTENGGGGDNITFGNIYWGGKRVVFNANGYSVAQLIDESTNQSQDVSGYMDIWLYNKGSYSPVNSTSNAISVMQSANLIYTWDNTKLMSNCVFAIVHLKYNQKRATTGLQQTRFQLTNTRKNPADCIYDYLQSERYGAAISPSLIDTASLDELRTRSDEQILFTTYDNNADYMKRYQFDGVIDTSLKIMPNLQSMMDCCGCLLKYNEITGKWGVIVQKPTYTVAMDINNSNMISALTVSPIDVSNSFNIIEVKFPDGTQKDTFASATYDLNEINPSLLFPNEPVNKQSVNLYVVNNSVRAQYIANQMLEAARDDLQITVTINYVGLQLEAGDIVTVTNSNYGWAAKLFRINKVTQKFTEDGQVTATLFLAEFNPSVYDDKNVKQFTPAPNTGIGSALGFGTIPAPTIPSATSFPTAINPVFSVNTTTSTQGIVQYAEIWYSAFPSPTDSQRIFLGTTATQPNGDAYGQSVAMPPLQVFNLPAGDWYFFSRMVNNFGSSLYSPASAKFSWRPTNYQYTQQYLSIAYADNANGGGFSFNPRNKLYYGLLNQSTSTPAPSGSPYKWYLAEPSFGTNKYLVWSNLTNRRAVFDTDFATLAAGTTVLVPSTTTKFDPRAWSALPDDTNIIDLDQATGYVIRQGATGQFSSQGILAVQNTDDGRLIATLDTLLDFGGSQTFTGSATTITIDKYGRVLGFTAPDNFYMTVDYFTATAGQTVFTPTSRAAGYITGQDLIFRNGVLVPLADYTETSTTFTLGTACTVGERVACISFRAVSTNEVYESLNLKVASTSGTNMVWDATYMPYQQIKAGDKLTFADTGTPTQYTVSTVNYATRTITFTTNPTATAGNSVYRYRAAGSSYAAFSRWDIPLVDVTTYTPTEWAIRSGYELPFVNGVLINEQDYDIIGTAIQNFPATLTGTMSFIQFGQDNLGTPAGGLANVVRFTIAGTAGYSFTYTPNSFNLYANGLLLQQGVDYTTATGSYTFTSTPDSDLTVLVQQTVVSQGAA